MDELYESFSNLISDPTIVSIPYSYYGKSCDFNIYILYGDRIENDDHEFLRELYGLHDIIKNLYNKDYYHITLKSGKAIIFLFDYMSDGCHKNYLRRMRNYLYRDKIPQDIYRLICSGDELISGISTDNGSSNLSLFDWIYEPEKKP